MVWKLNASGPTYAWYIIPARKGLFIGGNKYAKRTLSLNKRGKTWEVTAVTPKAEVVGIVAKVSKAEGLKQARAYMRRNK